jgi:hypothetical protein
MAALGERIYAAATLRSREVLAGLTAPWRTLPDFLIIGTQRGGTASLYYNLTRHPGVAPAVRKEVHFFDVNYRRGLRWYRGHFPARGQMEVMRRRHGRAVTGEASPYYLFHPAAPGRVRAALPHAMLIVMLRNPVDRAYSHYQREVGKGRERLSFEEAIEAEPARLHAEAERLGTDESYSSDGFRQHSYLARGIYLPQLQRWMAEFPRDRFLILESEEFFTDPMRVLIEVEAFLGLPVWAPSGGLREFNVQRYAQMPWSLRGKLDAFFAPHNAALQSFLGRRLSWGPDDGA